MITIKNKTKNKNIEVMHAKSPLALTKGLMFKKKGNMLLEFPLSARHSIWMLFMRYPLDLIYIDKQKKITQIKKNIPPITLNPKTWKTYHPKEKAKYVLEMQACEPRDFEFSAGDTLQFDT